MAAALTVGTVWGDDDDFPFGPLRMYSTSSPPNGGVTELAIEARVGNAPYDRAALSPANVGMNRAEVEGQVPKIVADPAILGTLAAAHARLKPHQPDWTAVRLVRRRHILVDRKPTGQVDVTVVAEWVRP
jgi:hypothetical protein